MCSVKYKVPTIHFCFSIKLGIFNFNGLLKQLYALPTKSMQGKILGSSLSYQETIGCNKSVVAPSVERLIVGLTAV